LSPLDDRKQLAGLLHEQVSALKAKLGAGI